MTKEELLDCLRSDPGSAARLAQQPGWEFRLLRELAQTSMDVPGVPLFLASVQEVPSSILKQLCHESTDAAVVHLLAQNLNCQEELCHRPEAWVRESVAGCRRLAPKVPSLLLADPSVPVRCRLAANPAIAPNVQTRLSQDQVPLVRLSLLATRKTDNEILLALCDDMDTTVHLAALMAPSLPYDCIRVWAGQGEELGLLALCRRNDLPPNIVELISKSPFPSVQKALLRFQALPEGVLARLAAEGDAEVLMILAGRTTLPAALQETILERADGAAEVVRTLAANRGVAPALALRLTGSDDAAVLEALALNPGAGPDSGATPRPDAEDTLFEAHSRLAAGGGEELCKRLLANPCARCEGLIRILAGRATPTLRNHMLFRGLLTAD